ncbi:alpha/beta fold hydrolase [Micromonospora tarensis]|uniref:Alpha/beta hydrolase n=1 Tax=Micromonospora tarensis TaxID=2806100 RepID=A0ABS1YKR6_9ACTN|nr:alpha/beta hydrolase [Micromonospora tarensis]MBM0278025.1 alpha/beta hydrolase [Micromonospora tarensis]
MSGPRPDRTAPVVVTRRRAAHVVHRRILFLHGLGNSDEVWNAAIARWPDPHAELWSADLPWRLDFPGEWRHGADLTGYLAEATAGVPGTPDVVVAHSFAANLLLEWLTVPVRPTGAPAGAVLVSPFYRPSPDAFGWPDLERFPQTFRRVIEAGVAVHSAGRLAPQRLDDVVARVCDIVGPYGWARFLQTYLATPWLRTELVDMPCLVLAGADDFCPPAAESIALAGALPDARLHTFPDGGHFAMVERPDAFAAAVATFCTTLRPRSPALFEEKTV